MKYVQSYIKFIAKITKYELTTNILRGVLKIESELFFATRQ